MHETLQYILTEVRSAWRFRWLALAAAWVVCLVGWAVVSMMPDVYEANARVYVDTSSELRQILGDQIIEPDVESQLNYVREAMLGRVQLEKVARQTGLDLRTDSPNEFEALIARLREDVQLVITGNPALRGRPSAQNLYAISYRDIERPMALNVVQTILNNFVEDTLGSRQQGSESARRFLEQQVIEYEARLAVSEDRLARFKRENADVLPGTEGGYFQRLQAETSTLEEVRQNLALAQSRRDRLVEQLSGTRPLSPRTSETGEPLPGTTEARIAENEARLEELLLRYTDRHPDVVATRATLDRLRQQQEAEHAAAQASGSVGARSDNPVLQALQISLNEAEVEIASLSSDVAMRQARVARLRSLIDEVPEVEAQLARLDRDYDIVNAQYQALVRSLETERLTREASESDQIEFRVIDPPTSPSAPVAPKRPFMLLFVLAAGLGGGGGGAWLLAQLQPVFPTPRSLREVTGLPVLGAISLTWRDKHRVRRRAELLSFGFGCVALVAVFSLVFVIEVTGPGLRGLVA
ncbi:MAG: lipopolysaccharide biosynthesis protein [Gammaproteobacteria bacterium]|nr:lipopolysaccharide biosynthesis protein [Gammaproteobacteria bacterium]